MMSSCSLPISLYIHLPWCIKKCPYCDFNSHVTSTLPKQEYIKALLNELSIILSEQPNIQSFHSVFIGGGTPSLFTPDEIQILLTGIDTLVPFKNNLEITLEANPGTLEHSDFKHYAQAGVNRLSLGIQSLNNTHLNTLGRIHSADEALMALEQALNAGFKSINCDLMYALPNQSIDEALADLTQLLNYPINHLSWYQLTIERNTYFFSHTPKQLPKEDTIYNMEHIGYEQLKQAGFQRYEISAFAKPDQTCQHNLNYWQFGDYLGLGAGAHSKLTHCKNNTVHSIMRFNNYRNPQKYLACTQHYCSQQKEVAQHTRAFEFMLNACRLTSGFESNLISKRAGVPLKNIQPSLTQAKEKNLIIQSGTMIKPTPLGIRFHNDLVNLF